MSRFASLITFSTLLLAPAYAQQDPVIQYTREISRAEFIFVTTDVAGDVVAVGRTNNSQFLVSSRALQTRFGGGACGARPCYDVVVMKFRASDGEPLAATFLGGSGDDTPTAIATDAQGYIYVGGTTTSRNFPLTEGAIQGANRSSSSTGFVAKIHWTLSGAEFSTYLGGNAPTRIAAIAADRNGNAYVTGTTDARDFPLTPGAFRTTGAASMAYVTRISNGGRSLVSSTFLGAGTPAAIAADGLGHTVIVGTVSGDWPVTGGAYQATRRGSADVFLTRVNGNGGSLLYSTFLGGAANDQAMDLVIDGSENIYVGGVTYSPSFPGTSEVLGEVGTGFVTKFTGTIPVWTQTLRANGITMVTDLQLDPDQNVLATGTTNSTHFPTTSGAYHRCIAPQSTGSLTPFQVRMAPDGTLRYSTLLHENVTGEKWAAFPREGGVITLNRPASAFEQVPASNLRRYTFTAVSASRVDCAINSASYRTNGVTPGMIVTLFGNGIGPATGVIGSFVDSVLPTSLGGVRVLFDGVPAPLLFVREDQINAVAPFGIVPGTNTSIQVEYANASITPIRVTAKAADAGIFRLGSSEFGAILNEDGTINSPANPAARGSVITFWSTGMGPFEQIYLDGALVRLNYSVLRTPARVSIGGVAGEVLYSGSSPEMVAGVTQVNVQIAPGTRASSRLPLTVSLGEITFSELAYVSVK